MSEEGWREGREGGRGGREGGVRGGVGEKWEMAGSMSWSDLTKISDEGWREGGREGGREGHMGVILRGSTS